jgi:hypothetical protein
MKRPKQLPAVDRNIKTSTIPEGVGGVRPSFNWADLAGIGNGPVITNGFGPAL